MNNTNFVVDGAQLDLNAGDANTFKGFGYISCNNSSRLLMDYKTENPRSYQQILDILFGGKQPLLRMLKIELGDDANTSSGAEPAPLRHKNDTVNVRRGAGYQLIADVKKIQPHLKTSLLRWGEPGWLKELWFQVKSNDPDHNVPESAFEPMYQYYKKTIIAAYSQYGYLFDYVNPDRNENIHPMVHWIKWFAQRLRTDSEDFPQNFPVKAYQQIKIIAADQNYETNFGDYMISDAELRQLVTAVGYHYNTDDGVDQPYTKLADQYHHEVWYSEGVSPMTSGQYRVRSSEHTGIGGQQSGLDVANRVIKSYAKSRRSLYLFQPAVAAYYPGVNYSHKELITAQRPWSGYFEVDNVGLQIIKHFTDFAVCGWQEENAWRYLPSACHSDVGGTENLNQNTAGASYLTLISPDQQDYSIILVNDSPETRTYQVQLKNLPATLKPVYLWASTGPMNSQEAYDVNLKHQLKTQEIQNHQLTIEVTPFTIITATTLDKRNDPNVVYHRLVSPVADTVLQETDDVLYQDNFDYSKDYLQKRGNTPRYTTDQGGAFEVVSEEGQHYLQQMITEKERALDWEYSFAPNFTIGDDLWHDYQVTVKMRFDVTTMQNSAEGNYFGIGLRETTDASGQLESAPYIFKLTVDGHYQLIVRNHIILNDTLDSFTNNSWHTLSFAANSNTIYAIVDNQKLFSWQDTTNPTYTGRVKIGCGYYQTQIESMSIQRPDNSQILTKRLDNLDQQIQYYGNWQHQVGIQNTLWQRTLSTGTAQAFNQTYCTFDFVGTGFILVGQQKQSCTLKILIDNHVCSPVFHPNIGGNRASNGWFGGFKSGPHHVQLIVSTGNYNLDAIEFLK